MYLAYITQYFIYLSTACGDYFHLEKLIGKFERVQTFFLFSLVKRLVCMIRLCTAYKVLIKHFYKY